MKKPDAVVQLLEELKDENRIAEAETLTSSHVDIYINAEAAQNNDPIVLSADECKVLFAEIEVLERLIDAINSEDATITLVDMNVSEDMLEVLERSFTAVDEE